MRSRVRRRRGRLARRPAHPAPGGPRGGHRALRGHRRPPGHRDRGSRPVTDTGRMLARILASVARGEVERKGARQRRANEQRAATGTWAGPGARSATTGPQTGGRRRRAGGRGAEAAAEMVLDGRHAGRRLPDARRRGLTTTAGKPWNVTACAGRCCPTVAGRVTYRGADVAKGSGRSSSRRRPGTAGREAAGRQAPRAAGHRRRFLLSGLARCGRCDGVMFASHEDQGQPWQGYRCPACYLARRQDLVDELVEGVVSAGCTGRTPLRCSPEARTSPLCARSARNCTRRDDLAGLLADGLLSASVVRERSRSSPGESATLRTAISHALGESPVTRLVGTEDVQRHGSDARA